MPIITVTNVYFLDVQDEHRAIEVRVAASTTTAIFDELRNRFPRFPRRLVDGAGNHSERYALIRELDDEDVRYLPDETVFGEDERFYLMDTVGC